MHWGTKEVVCHSIVKPVAVRRFCRESHHRSWIFKWSSWRYSTDYCNEKSYVQSSANYNFPTLNISPKICATWVPFCNHGLKSIPRQRQHRKYCSKIYKLHRLRMRRSWESHAVLLGSRTTFASMHFTYWKNNAHRSMWPRLILSFHLHRAIDVLRLNSGRCTMHISQVHYLESREYLFPFCGELQMFCSGSWRTKSCRLCICLFWMQSKAGFLSSSAHIANILPQYFA